MDMEMESVWIFCLKISDTKRIHLPRWGSSKGLDKANKIQEQEIDFQFSWCPAPLQLHVRPMHIRSEHLAHICYAYKSEREKLIAFG